MTGESFLQEEGGRHTPFFKNYKPQFFFRTADVTGTIELRGDTEMVMPGDNVTVDVTLINPIAMEKVIGPARIFMCLDNGQKRREDSRR